MTLGPRSELDMGMDMNTSSDFYYLHDLRFIHIRIKAIGLNLILKVWVI
jgi:hypothetical protein